MRWFDPETQYKIDLRRLALRKQGWKCFYCFAPLTAKNATADHRVARSRGGTTAADNIVAACGECNYAKGSRRPEQFDRSVKQNQYDGSVELIATRMRRKLWLRTYEAVARVEKCL